MSGDGLHALERTLERAIDAVATPTVFASAAISLSVVFLLSALPKLRHPVMAASAISDFGIQRDARPWTGFALGSAELALACMLLLVSMTSSTAIRAMVLGLAMIVLWAFSGIIFRALLAHEEFACRCFGGESSRISVYTLIRTGLMAGIATALFVASFSDLGVPGMSDWLAEAVIAVSLIGSVVLMSSFRSIVSTQ